MTLQWETCNMAAGQVAKRDTATLRTAELPQGRELVVRQSRVEDLNALQALYAGLDTESRLRRFFSLYDPPRSFFEHLVAIEGRGGAGLVACVRSDDSDSEDLVGEANFEMLSNGDGEFAITVSRLWRGWLGPYLLDTLLELAASRGVPNLEADILASNTAMLALVRSRGYVVVPDDDWTTLRVFLPAGPGGPRWPLHRTKFRLLIEGSGSHTVPCLAAAAADVEVLQCSGPHARGVRCPLLAGEDCLLATRADAIVLVDPDDSPEWERIREWHHELNHHPLVWTASPRGRVALRPNETTLVGGYAELTDVFGSLVSPEQR